MVNLHFHTLALDGVFTEGPSRALEFHPAPAPSDAEVAAALTTVRHRVRRLLVRRVGFQKVGPSWPEFFRSMRPRDLRMFKSFPPFA